MSNPNLTILNNVNPGQRFRVEKTGEELVYLELSKDGLWITCEADDGTTKELSWLCKVTYVDIDKKEG